MKPWKFGRGQQRYNVYFNTRVQMVLGNSNFLCLSLFYLYLVFSAFHHIHSCCYFFFLKLLPRMMNNLSKKWLSKIVCVCLKEITQKTPTTRNINQFWGIEKKLKIEPPQAKTKWRKWWWQKKGVIESGISNGKEN